MVGHHGAQIALPTGVIPAATSTAILYIERGKEKEEEDVRGAMISGGGAFWTMTAELE
jgi:hypothetical protein